MAELEGAQIVEPISLYFDLEDGFVADLEIVSRAALAWTAAIKEVAVMVDPFLDVRIEVASGTPGSLSLNSLLRDLRITKEEEKITLKALAFIILAWMGAQAFDTFKSIRWASTEGAPFCPRCGCVRIYTLSDSRRFKCAACLHKFSVISDAIRTRDQRKGIANSALTDFAMQVHSYRTPAPAMPPQSCDRLLRQGHALRARRHA